MTKEKYNGFTNYYTWLVYTWLTNTEQWYLELIEERKKSDNKYVSDEILIKSFIDVLFERFAFLLNAPIITDLFGATEAFRLLFTDIVNSIKEEINYKEIGEIIFDDVQLPENI